MTQPEPTSIDLAVVGGSGLYNFPGLQNVSRHAVDTPYGAASGEVALGDFAGMRVAFLARHGEGHSLPPHRVNYRANLWALQRLGARRVVGVNAVGGIRHDMGPQAIVVPEQLIDYTHGRHTSYCDVDGAEVRHIDFSEPYTESLRRQLLAAAAAAGGRGDRRRLLRRHAGAATGNPGRDCADEARWLRPGRHDRHARGGPGARAGAGLRLPGPGGELRRRLR